jgi:hypothetical protein
VLFDPEGFRTFTAEIGQGSINFDMILMMLSTLPNKVNLSIEDHGGDFLLPTNNKQFLAEFPDITREEMLMMNKLSQIGCPAKPLPRDKWPNICESRLKRDIQSMKSIAIKY